MLRIGFIIFCIFFLFFSEFSCAGWVWTELGTKILFFTFSAYLIPFWLKIMPESGFLIFWFFCYLFCNFLYRVEYERNSGLKVFTHFLSLSHPVLAKNNARRRFYNFLNFFTLFLRIFFPGSSMNGIRYYIFFFSFSANLIPFWQKIMLGWSFLIFLLFFLKFSCPRRLWTEFGTKILFSPFRLMSSRFG